MIVCVYDINRQPVKSSRLFLGHLHETALKQISDHFRKPEDYYKKIKANNQLSNLLKSRYSGEKIFFKQVLIP